MNIVEEPRYNPNSNQPNGQQGGFQQLYPYNSTGTQMMSMPQQRLPGPGRPFGKGAPIGCNCCSWSHDSCAQFWAIFNLIQVYMCYFLIVIGHLLWEWSNSLVKNPRSQKKDDPNECWELYHVVGTPPTNITFSVEILLLLLYTIGSIFFAAAVFHKTLGSQQRSKFMLIHILLIASLPLAYFIPLVIRFYLCIKAGTGTLTYVGGWFIIIMSTTIPGAHATWVLRKWVMAGSKNSTLPIPQPRMEGFTPTSDTSQQQKVDGDQGTN